MIDTKELRRIAEASTRVVSWYAHSQYDGYHLGKAAVRGPFGRWFLVQGGDNGMGESVPTPVADLYDDAKFAAAAMNNLVPLIDELEACRTSIKASIAYLESTGCDTLDPSEPEFQTLSHLRQSLHPETKAPE